MTEISMKQLLEAGVHFGHQTSRWNPKMKQYIFGARNGIYIIDLQQTVKMFRATFDFARDLAAAGGTMLFVGTKKQAQDIVKEEAERCGMYYVNNRWLGGMLTNFQTIRASIDRLRKLEETMADPEMIKALTKKEMSDNGREHEKLMNTLAGIKNMRKLPDALWVIDTKKEDIAVAEANRLGIPGCRSRRYQLRPGFDRVSNPRQRRRDSRDQAVHGRRGRRDSRRQADRRGARQGAAGYSLGCRR